jgi:hypothetical protein
MEQTSDEKPQFFELGLFSFMGAVFRQSQVSILRFQMELMGPRRVAIEAGRSV